MAEAAHDVLYLRGCLRAPAFFRHPENSGGVSCRHVFLRAEVLHLTPRASMFKCVFLLFALFYYRLCFFRRLSLYAHYCLRKVQCSHCLRLLCCGSRNQLKESGHVRSAPWTSTARRQSYYVQFRQEAGTAGAVASDGDLATNSQIVGSEGRPLDLKGRESTEERSRTLAVSDRCDVGRMVAAAAAIQRQCERVRRRRLCVAVRRSGVVVSFAVIAAIALRRHRRLFRIRRYVICRRYRRVFVFAIYSSSPSLFISCIIIVSPCTFIIVASRFIRCIILTCCSVCLSWTHSLSSL
jgi:hypothetical protein